MAIWQIIYHPPRDDKDSPYQYLLRLPDPEFVRVAKRLDLVAELEFPQWRGISWLKMWGAKIWQIDGTQTRLMFFVDGNRIVVLHACKKVKQKTHRRDVKRVELNLADYLESRAKQNDDL